MRRYIKTVTFCLCTYLLAVTPALADIFYDAAKGNCEPCSSEEDVRKLAEFCEFAFTNARNAGYGFREEDVNSCSPLQTYRGWDWIVASDTWRVHMISSPVRFWVKTPSNSSLFDVGDCLSADGSIRRSVKHTDC